MRGFIFRWWSKMASTKSLEDMLSSDVDESAVSALVGSLESQLASPTIHVASQDISSTTNHVNNNQAAAIVMDNIAVVNRIHQHQENSGGAAAGGPTNPNALLISTAPSQPPQTNNNNNNSNSNNNTDRTLQQQQKTILNSVVSTSNVVMANSDSTPKAATPANLVAAATSSSNSGGIVVASSPALLPTTNANININTTVVCSPSTVANTPQVTTNTYAVTALPASGYLNQFPSVGVPGTPGTGSSVVQRTATIPNGNASGAAGAIAAALATPKVTQLANSATANIQAKPGGATPGIPTSASLNVNLTGIGAIQSLGVRHQQLAIPTSQTIQGHPGQTVIAVAKSGTHQQMTATGQVVTSAVNPLQIQPVQFVNVNQVRSGTPTNPGQKTLAPRLVIGNPVRITGQPVLGTRSAAPGTHGAVPNTITLPPGIRGTILVKTETGQYQIVNVSPALSQGAAGGSVPGSTTYRLPAMPGGQSSIRAIGSQPVTMTLPTTHANQHVKVQQPPPHQPSPHVVHTVLQAAHAPAVTMVSSASITHLTNSITNTIATPSLVQQVGLRGNSLVAVQTGSQPHTVATGQGTASPVYVSAATTTPTPPVPTSIATTANTSSSTAAATGAPSTTTAPQMSPDTAKKKCKNFLSTLLRLASDQPEQVATNVKNLIQGLIDEVVPPEEFTNQLQKELNSSPQPCLIPFLKKSLPYLRLSLITKELSIEGVRPPTEMSATGLPLTTAPHPPQPTAATVPTTASILSQQVQMATPVAIGTPRAPLTTQTHVRLVTPAGLPHVSHQLIGELNTPTSIATPLQRLPAPRKPAKVKQKAATTAQRAPAPIVTQGPGPLRPMVGPSGNLTLSQALISGLQRAPVAGPSRLAAPRPAAVGTVAVTAGTALAKVSTTTVGHHLTPGPPLTAAMTTVGSISVPASSTIPKEKEKRVYSSTLKDDDDINDVAAMGGVNLVEESARIMAQNAEFVGTQIRSCKDENFLFTPSLQYRLRTIAARYGLDEPSPEVAALISHATQERLKDIVEKLGVIAEHRLDIVKSDPRHEVTQDTKGQLKFLEELDRLEKKRHEEQEREILLRAAKSRSKLEDPEQLKLKQKAKEMQRAELEEMRQREANMTALLAIGPRKKFKADTQNAATDGQQPSTSGLQSGLNTFNSSSAKPQKTKDPYRSIYLPFSLPFRGSLKYCHISQTAGGEDKKNTCAIMS